MTILTDPRQTLHGRLRAARQIAGLDQLGIAEAVGVGRQTISNWENGHNEIGATALIRWAEVTKVSLDWIAWGTVRPEGFEPPAYCSVAGYDVDDCAACDAPLSSCSREDACCDDCTHGGNWAPLSVRDLVLAA